jgi:hypothetical protein
MLAVAAPPPDREATQDAPRPAAANPASGSEIASLLLKSGVLTEAQFTRIRRVQ